MTVDEILALRWTKAMRRAMLRKQWIPRGRSGGEVLLAQRLEGLGLFERDSDPGELHPHEYFRTKLGHQVVQRLNTTRIGR